MTLDAPRSPHATRATGEPAPRQLCRSQSAGEQLDPLFWFRRQGPPHFSYNGARCPEGPLFAPLWDCCNEVTGIWVRDGKLEFIEFSIDDDPAEFLVLAHTEQGLWTTVFVNLYEDNDKLAMEDFRRPARAVGFRFLDWLIASYESGVKTSEPYERYVSKLDGEIDGESAAT